MGHTRHDHPGAEEIIYVLEGTGEQMVEDDTGNRHTEQVHPGTCIFIPESRFHSMLNTGAVEMRIFVVYSPAGPASPSIGIEPSFLPYNSAKVLEAAYPNAPLVDATGLMERLRAVKTPAERVLVR